MPGSFPVLIPETRSIFPLSFNLSFSIPLTSGQGCSERAKRAGSAAGPGQEQLVMPEGGMEHFSTLLAAEGHEKELDCVSRGVVHRELSSFHKS